jgi:hypothetical protein
MPKNVVFFADGTGNDRAHGFKTNVAKLSDDAENMRVSAGGPTWQDLSGPALDAEVDRPDVLQITSDDAGVGTEMGDLIGRATGSGISRNIQDGYDFIVRFYAPGDRIFLFGFSRGAYTVRSLAGLIGLCGVAQRLTSEGRDLRHDDEARGNLVSEAYTVYKKPAPVRVRLDPLHLQGPPHFGSIRGRRESSTTSREGFWKRLVYREVPRFVCKGHQEPLSKITVKTGEAYLHTSWLERIGALYEAYDTPHLGGHPDYVRAVDELKRGITPAWSLGLCSLTAEDSRAGHSPLGAGLACLAREARETAALPLSRA